MVRFGVSRGYGDMDRGLKVDVSYETERRMALECERLGFDSFLRPDSLLLSTGSLPECWVTLGALAGQTKRIAIGPYVSCIMSRHPALLARMAATLDVISNGRLQLAVGACGWGQEVDHRAVGLLYPEYPERIHMLKEAIQVLRMMFRGESTNFKGRFYTIRNAVCNPKPIQQPMRIWTGGSGGPLLKVAAEAADGFDTGFCTLEGFQQMNEQLDRECDLIGRRSKEILRSQHWHSIIIGTKRSKIEEKKRRFIPRILENKKTHRSRWIRTIPTDEYIKRRFLIGTPEECVDTIAKFADAGAHNINVNFPDVTDLSSLRIFADEVIPAFRK